VFVCHFCYWPLMKISYKLSHICGNVFQNGNLLFTPDGNSIVSPIGNRVSMYDLINHKSTALPFENRKNIRRIAVSPDGRMLISIDIEGNSIFFNMARRLVLLHFNFKRKVYDIAFSPDSTMFAITFGRGCQIWRCPNTKLEFCPLTLLLNTSGLNDDVICLDWSTDSNSIMMG